MSQKSNSTIKMAKNGRHSELKVRNRINTIF